MPRRTHRAAALAQLATAYPPQLEGHASWDRDRDVEAEFERFLIRSEDEMAFDITFNGCAFSCVAKRERGDGPPRFFGQARASDPCAWRSAQVYFTVDEDRRSARLHLHGTWKEVGTSYDNWYAELEPRHS